MLVHTVTLDDGTIVIMAYSDEHDECPKTKKCVRAELINGGFILTPDPENPDKTFAQIISHCDLKGNVPKTIANTIGKKQGLLISKINDAMKKHF